MAEQETEGIPNTSLMMDLLDLPTHGTWMPSSTAPQFLLESKRALLRNRGIQSSANMVRGDWKSWEDGKSHGRLAWSKGDCLVSRFWAALWAKGLTGFYLDIRAEGRSFATLVPERIFRHISGQWILWTDVPNHEQQSWLSLCFTSNVTSRKRHQKFGQSMS